MGRKIFLDDDDLSDCSMEDDSEEMYDTDSTTTDSSFYVHHLIGQELSTIWELESYHSVASEDEGDDDIASIASDLSDVKQEDEVVFSNLPASDTKENSQSTAETVDDAESIDSQGEYEERWHVDKNGEAKKATFQDGSMGRDAKRKAIQRKMRALEQRITVIRNIVAQHPPKEEPQKEQPQEEEPQPEEKPQEEKKERQTRRGRRKPTKPPRVGRRRHRSLSPPRSMSPPKSPPRNAIFNDSLENRRKQVALARQKLHLRLGSKLSDDDDKDDDNDNKKTSLTNPRHLHRRNMRAANGKSIPKRCQTA